LAGARRAEESVDMAQEGIAEVVNQQTWLDPISDLVQHWIEQAYAASGPIGTRMKGILSGTWLGHPLHPAITDIPLGSWTASAVLDVAEAATGDQRLGRGADATLVVGLVAALGAAVTGLSDWHYTTDRQRRVGIAHGLLNLSATGLYAVSWALRAGGKRGGGRAVAFAGYAVGVFSAWLGGDLVYDQHLGVNHAPETAPEAFVAVLRDSELREGETRRVEAGGVPVMLARQGGHVYALAESCAHLGGPLSEGQLDHGTITCPWHASRFVLDGGRVLDGPATFPQPCYQTRVRDGQIEVGPRRVPAQVLIGASGADGARATGRESQATGGAVAGTL
jgi:nitrite reductase/ring-hydroxylating ferredoxin subunit/uncharacterized membrane protein